MYVHVMVVDLILQLLLVMVLEMLLVMQQIGRIDGQDPRVMPSWMVEQRMVVMDVLDRMLEDVVVETRWQLTVLVAGEFCRVQNVFNAELE